jgi:transcriptional regulator with XRE-family HTH domain
LDVANNPAKRLPGRLKQLRLSLDLTQEKFAERAGLDYKYYQHIEAGRRQNLTMDILTKLAAGCGMELRELFDFESEPMSAAEDPPDDGFSGETDKRRRNAHKPRSGKARH